MRVLNFYLSRKIRYAAHLCTHTHTHDRSVSTIYTFYFETSNKVEQAIAAVGAATAVVRQQFFSYNIKNNSQGIFSIRPPLSIVCANKIRIPHIYQK